MTTLQVHQFPCLDDNYGYLVHDPESGLTATIDTPEVEAIFNALGEKNWSLDFILIPITMTTMRAVILKLKRRQGARSLAPAQMPNAFPASMSASEKAIQ